MSSTGTSLKANSEKFKSPFFTFSREEREVIFRKEGRRTPEQESSMDIDSRVETVGAQEYDYDMGL